MFIRTLKSYLKNRWLIIIFVVFLLLFLFDFNQSTNKETVFQSLVPQNKILNKVGLPVRLIIPAINVNAVIQHLGVTQTGEMEVPSNTVDVGWFKLGPHPGEKGSAVIAGHFNGENGEAGIFFNLYKLKEGDKLYIQNNKGTSVAFVVREKRLYNPGYANEVFSKNDNIYLNLITCDGVWNGTKKSYSKRLVVFADIE